MIKKYITMVLFLSAIGLLGGCGATEDKDIGKNKAQEIAFEDANVSESDLSELHISRENENGKTVYEVKFMDTISGTAYDYEILASDGTIQKVDKENGIPVTSGTQQNQSKAQNESQSQDSEQTHSNNQNSVRSESPNQDRGQNDSHPQVSISLEKAKKLALDRVSGAAENDLHIKLDYDDGHYIYEGEILYGQKEYEFEIDAETGTFLEWSEEIR